jgi:hypothetical protein
MKGLMDKVLVIGPMPQRTSGQHLPKANAATAYPLAALAVGTYPA